MDYNIVDAVKPKKPKAPFPYFGGKSKVADIVWEALGDCDHYLEPFFGSGAVLLARENWQGKTETVCDKDGLVANAWRAMQFDPDETAKWADWPVNHADLNARRKFLKEHKEDLYEKLCEDPKYYDAELGGYWIWGQSCGICTWIERNDSRPHLTNKGRGVHATRFGDVKDVFRRLSDRLRRVRVACGDWTRICGGNWQDSNWSSVGYFFDPPYGENANRDKNLYAEDSLTVASDVAKWCFEKGTKDNWRIVLAGYYEEHEWLLDHGWGVHRWRANGGYANKGKARSDNRHREALFFSPHCLNNKIGKEDAQLQMSQ